MLAWNMFNNAQEETHIFILTTIPGRSAGRKEQIQNYLPGGCVAAGQWLFVVSHFTMSIISSIRIR